MTTDAVGGVWTYSIGLTRQLAQAGTETTLVVLGPSPSDEQRMQAASVPRLRLVECAEALEWMDDPWDGVARSGERLLSLAQEVRADVVHLNGYSHAALPFDCPTLVVAHSCVLSWWEAVKSCPAPPRYARYKHAVEAGLERASQIVAPSKAMLRALQRHYGVRRGEVVYNGVASVASPSSIKENIVLSVGRLWDEAKNVSALMAVSKELDIPIHVAGPDSGPMDGVVRLGVLSAAQLRDWFARASIYASPAFYEPFGLAALEAASYGAALILGDIESQRELWGDAALYVAPNDTAALRRAIELLTRNASFRELMAHRARKRAKMYSLTEQARHYADLYSRIMRKDATAPTRFHQPSASKVAV